LVEVRARPSPGYRFIGWTGGISGTLPNVTVKVHHDMRVVARFAPAEPSLRIASNTVTQGGTASVDLYLEGDTASLEGIQTEINCPVGLQFGPPHRGANIESSVELLYAIRNPQQAVLLMAEQNGTPSLASDSEIPVFSFDITADPDCAPGLYEVALAPDSSGTAVSYADGRRWKVPQTVRGIVEVVPPSGISLMLVAAPLWSDQDAAEPRPSSLDTCRADQDYYLELWLQDQRSWGEPVTDIGLDVSLPSLATPVQVETTSALNSATGGVAGSTVANFGGNLLADTILPGYWHCVGRLRVHPENVGTDTVGMSNAWVELADETVLSVPAIQLLPESPLTLAQVPNEAPDSCPSPAQSGHWGTQISGTLGGRDANPDDILRFSIVSGPAHGQIVFFDSATGNYTYVASANHTGSDSFTFTVSDGTLTSAEATQELLVSQGWCAHFTRGDAWCSFGQDTEATANDTDALDTTAAGGSLLTLRGRVSGGVLQRDLRGMSGTPVWRVTAAASATASRLCWDPLAVPDGLHLVQLSPAVEDQVFIDLRAQDSLELLPDTEYVFDLSMLESCDLSLQRGWNLVAFPGTPLHADLADLYATPEGGDSAVLEWRDGAYGAPTQLGAFAGYWIYASQDVARAVATVPAFQTTVQLNAGWNLFGVPYPTSMPAGTDVSGTIWTFRNLRYEPATRLVPGTGYWVFARTNLSVTFVEEVAP
jgi:hypothetical protein